MMGRDDRPLDVLWGDGERLYRRIFRGLKAVEQDAGPFQNARRPQRKPARRRSWMRSRSSETRSCWVHISLIRPLLMGWIANLLATGTYRVRVVIRYGG